MLFETDADQKGSSPRPCPGFSTCPLDLRLICKGRAEKNNENKIKRKSESTGNNCLRAWLRVQEPTGACSSKLLRDTSVCWAQKLRRRVDTARASLEWMLGLRGRGRGGRKRKKEKGRQTKRKGERERQKGSNGEKEERTDREADRGRLEEGGQEKRGESSRIPCHQGHQGSSQDMRREQTSRQPPTTSSDRTATRRGPPWWPRPSETETPQTRSSTWVPHDSQEHPRKDNSPRTAPCAEDAEKESPGVFPRPMVRVSTFPYHHGSSNTCNLITVNLFWKACVPRGASNPPSQKDSSLLCIRLWCSYEKVCVPVAHIHSGFFRKAWGSYPGAHFPYRAPSSSPRLSAKL